MLGSPTAFPFPSAAGTVFPFQFGSITLDAAGVATVTPSIGADLQRYFQPPDDNRHLLRHEGGANAKALIGGEAALAAMRADIESTSGTGDFIYLLSWHCDVDMPLPNIAGGGTLPLTSLLSAKVAAGVQIRAMLWAGVELPHLPATSPPLVIPYELARAYFAAKTTTSGFVQRRVNGRAVSFINGLAGTNRDAVAILDGKHLSAGSHHQKILVLGVGGKLIAYVGGIEFNEDRVRPIPNEPGSPLFDISVRLEEGAAFPALETFKSRWTNHADQRGAPLRAGGAIPLPVGGPLTVQMTHTYGKDCPFSVAVQTASVALANGICNAKQFFYMEDQYFVGSNKLNQAIRIALNSKLNPGLIGIIVIAAEDSVADLPDLPFRRRAFLRPLATDFPGRFLVFERLGNGSTTGETAYVHSKLLIVDDEAAFIGSVNSNRRSWFHDTEVDATIVDTLRGRGGVTPATQGWVRDLRCQLWSRHFKRPVAGLGDPFADLFIWQGIGKGTVLGTSVRPYDVNAAVPRFTFNGHTFTDDQLEKGWDTFEDPV